MDDISLSTLADVTIFEMLQECFLFALFNHSIK